MEHEETGDLRPSRLHAHLRQGKGWRIVHSVWHTIVKRMRAKLVEIKEAVNRMRHVPVPQQGRWLGQVVRGYLAYHAVPTNSRKITSFHHFVVWH